MNLLDKFPYWIIIILLVAILSFSLFTLFEMANKSNDIIWDMSKTTQEILDYNTVRARTVLAKEAELRKLRDQLNLPTNETPIVGTSTTYTTPGGSTVSEATQSWPKATWVLSLPDDKGTKIKLAHVTLSEDNQWTIQVIKQTYLINHIVQETNTGEWNTYTQMVIKDEEGTQLRPQAVKSDTLVNRHEWEERQPKAKMNWWNPKFSLGAELHGYKTNTYKVSPMPSLSTSFMGYGPTKHDQKLKILEVILTADTETVGLGVSPISIRVSEKLPNTYIRPVNFGYRNYWDKPTGSISIGTGINVTF